MSLEELFINGNLLRLRREARGWVLNDMATRACMSVKQIRQLEEGGTSAFYSVAVKATAAKKVGALLGLSADEVFAHEVMPDNPDTVVPSEVPTAEPVVASNADQTATEPTHVQSEPELENVGAADSVSTPIESIDSKDETPRSKNALWLIALLLGTALAVGAYFQPAVESVVEPPPPLQVLPADMVDPAKAASAADEPASSPELILVPASATAVPVSQKPLTATVSSVVTASPQPAPVASASRSSAPVAVVAPTARTSSAPVAAAPSASAASKAP